jgi:WS/DGAT/MGAT family acyltransferase
MPEREKLSAVDTAWLRMDRPGNLMVITAVMLLHGPLRRARLEAVLQERFLCFARFRQFPVEEGTSAFWATADAFDIREHLLEVDLPAPGGQHALQGLISRLAATPLARDRPLWQFHLVRNVDHGAALVARIHHCYADGIALTEVLLSMTDAGPRGPVAMPFAPARKRRASPALVDLPWLAAPVNNALSMASRIGTKLVQKGAELWMNPLKAMELAQEGGHVAREVAKLALMGEDSRTRFKTVPQGHKRVAWAPPLPLAEVKALGKALQASVNDVLRAANAVLDAESQRIGAVVDLLVSQAMLDRAVGRSPMAKDARN